MTAKVRVALVAARAANGVIGQDGALPWRLSSDLKNFKTITLGKPIVMGRRTWDSIGAKPLPGRSNLVISRDSTLKCPGAWVFSDLKLAMAAAGALAAASGANEVCVIGGALIYRQILPEADRIYLTDVDVSLPGDAFFPQFDETLFRETDRKQIPRGNKDEHACVVRVLDRI